MNWKEKVFRNFKLYAVTDLKSASDVELRKVEAAYRGGVDIVQLRSKALSDADLYLMGVKIRKIADRHKKLFFVNDRPDIAVLVKADGVHLGQDDLSIDSVRKYFRKSNIRMWIGKSTHSLKQALDAQAEKVDYIGVGPVFETPTKPNYVPVGLRLIKKVSAAIRLPFVAIGGIDESNLETVLRSGAKRIAVVRAIFAQERIENAARRFCSKIEEFRNE